LLVRPPTLSELRELRTIAKLQFRGIPDAFIPEDIRLVLSPSTHKIRYLILDGKHYLSVRASDYRFVLHIPAGLTLHKLLPQPFCRVYVSHKYAGFIADGGNVFTKHVVWADPDIRPGDEVVVIDYDTGEVIGVGKASKPGWEMIYYGWGEGVRIREGINEV